MRLISLCCLFALPALADDAQDTVKERQVVMKAMGAHLKALAPIAQKKLALPGHAEVHAKALVDLTRLARELFPKGSGPAKAQTDAKEAVWTDEKKFVDAFDKMAQASDALVKAVEKGPDGLKGALDGVNDACSGCHKPFRAER